MLKKTLLILVLAAAGLWLYLPYFDQPTLSGELMLPPLSEPVEVLRGDDGMPYVYANSLDDGLTAQGFLHAQQRMFQLELYRYLAHGRLAEFIGPAGLGNDRTMRLLDMSGFAARMATQISPRERNYLQRYLDGVNAFIYDHSKEGQDEFLSRGFFNVCQLLEGQTPFAIKNILCFRNVVASKFL